MNYSDSFTQQRETNYVEAMRRWPYCRTKEFRNLFLYSSPVFPVNVLDVPAMDGYLARFLPDYCNLTQINFAGYFNGGLTVSPESSQWTAGAFDLIVCNAAMHHIERKQVFLQNLSNQLAFDGVIAIADPAKDGKIARFLDKNIKNHNGQYTDWTSQKLPDQLQILKTEEMPCAWGFASTESMVNFCRLLFSCPSLDLEILQQEVGVERLGSTFYLLWELEYAWLGRTPKEE